MKIKSQVQILAEIVKEGTPAESPYWAEDHFDNLVTYVALLQTLRYNMIHDDFFEFFQNLHS